MGKNTQSFKKISDAGENINKNYYFPGDFKHDFDFKSKKNSNTDFDKNSEKLSFTYDSQDVLDSEEKELEAYQFGLQKFQKKTEENSSYKNTNKKKEYKEKARKKMQEILNKQNEVHKFQIESLKKFYEEKISKYKEIIAKLQHENEELSNGSSMVKHSDLVNPLIEENMWLKNQMGRLSNKKYNL